ncbi:MAG: hypothetical protein ACKV1O_10175 [Saprospiraceae bacterium]
MQHFAKTLRSFVAANRAKLVLAILDDFLPGQLPHLHNEALLLQASLSQAERDFATGVATRSEVQQNIARVNAGLLNIIGEIARHAGDEKQAIARAKQIESDFQHEEAVIKPSRKPAFVLWAIGLPLGVIVSLLGWYVLKAQEKPEMPSKQVTEQPTVAKLDSNVIAKDQQKSETKTTSAQQVTSPKTTKPANTPEKTIAKPSRSSNQMAFRHFTTTTNTSGQTTTLDHPKLNGNPKAIIFILPNANANGADAEAKAYTQNAGVRYNGSRWTIVNQNSSESIPKGMTFNVLIAPPSSRNCFTVIATKANTSGFPHGMVIDNPASNGKTDAMLLVTQNVGTVTNDVSQIISYTNGKWHIFNNGYMDYHNGKTTDTRSFMPSGARFNVMVIENNIVPGFSNASAFMHTVKASNTVSAEPWRTVLKRADLTGNRNVMLFATAYWGHSDGDRTGSHQWGGPENEGPLVAWYDHPNDKQHFKDNAWLLYNGNKMPIPDGAKINVVVIPVK